MASSLSKNVFGVIWSLLVVLGIFSSSCINGPVIRNRRGLPISESSLSVSDLGTNLKKKLVLLKIFNESPFGGEDLEVVASEELRMELEQAQRFQLASPNLQFTGNSKEIYSGGGVKLGLLAKNSRQNGVSFALFGRIKESRVREKDDEIGLFRKSQAVAEIELELRMYDVLAEKEIMVESIPAVVENSKYKFFMSDSSQNRLRRRQDLLRYAVRVAVRKFIPRVIAFSEKVEWLGRVAKIVGHQIYINAGRSSGLQIGDILEVITDGSEIFDPETGALIGRTPGNPKGTLEVIGYFGPDGTIATLISGGTILEGDYVHLY